MGIVPSHVEKHALNTTFVAPVHNRYSKVKMQSGSIESFLLVRNPKWYGARAPYIDSVEMRFYKSDADAKKALLGQEILALVGDFQMRAGYRCTIFRWLKLHQSI